MGKNKKIKANNRVKAELRGKDISKALELYEDSWDRDDYPVFSFRHADNNRYLLSEWQEDELKSLIETFKKMESLKWSEINKHKGLNCKPVDPDVLPAELPEMVSPDVTILQIRVSKKARIFGYRIKNVFHLIWFDRNHDVFSMS